MSPGELTERQQQMLVFVREYLTTHAYPPSIRDIRKGLGIASNATVSRRLDELSELGWIYRDKRVARGILLAVKPTTPTLRRGWMTKMPLIRGFDVDARLHRLDIWSANSSNEIIELPRSLVGDEGDLFAAQVRGNTLLDAMVTDGDIVVMKQATVARTGELVAVWFSREEKTMLKHLVVEATGRMRLQAANPTWKTIFAWRTTAEVQARVVLVLRLIDHKLY